MLVVSANYHNIVCQQIEMLANNVVIVCALLKKAYKNVKAKDRKKAVDAEWRDKW